MDLGLSSGVCPRRSACWCAWVLAPWAVACSMPVPADPENLAREFVLPDVGTAIDGETGKVETKPLPLQGFKACDVDCRGTCTKLAKNCGNACGMAMDKHPTCEINCSQQQLVCNASCSCSCYENLPTGAAADQQLCAKTCGVFCGDAKYQCGHACGIKVECNAKCQSQYASCVGTAGVVCGK